MFQAGGPQWKTLERRHPRYGHRPAMRREPRLPPRELGPDVQQLGPARRPRLQHRAGRFDAGGLLSLYQRAGQSLSGKVTCNLLIAMSLRRLIYYSAMISGWAAFLGWCVSEWITSLVERGPGRRVAEHGRFRPLRADGRHRGHDRRGDRPGTERAGRHGQRAVATAPQRAMPGLLCGFAGGVARRPRGRTDVLLRSAAGDRLDGFRTRRGHCRRSLRPIAFAKSATAWSAAQWAGSSAACSSTGSAI